MRDRKVKDFGDGEFEIQMKKREFEKGPMKWGLHVRQKREKKKKIEKIREVDMCLENVEVTRV